MGKIGAIQMVAARAHQLADLMHMWLSRQLTGGATRHWKEAVNVTAAVAAAVVAEAMERKRAAVDRAASMRRCILQLDKIVVLSLRPGPYMCRHYFGEYPLEGYFLRSWYVKYMFEWYP